MNSDPIAYGLPHRAPFIFIDAVCEVRAGQSAICEKKFAVSEPFFRGHFPDQAIVPGVILTEALAQTAGIAAGETGKSFRLTAIRQMKFLRAVRPEETIRLQAEKTLAVSGLLQFQVLAEVDGNKVAEGVIVLSEA